MILLVSLMRKRMTIMVLDNIPESLNSYNKVGVGLRAWRPPLIIKKSLWIKEIGDGSDDPLSEN